MSYFMDRLFKIFILNYLKQHYFLSKKAPKQSCALYETRFQSYSSAHAAHG